MREKEDSMNRSRRLHRLTTLAAVAIATMAAVQTAAAAMTPLPLSLRSPLARPAVPPAAHTTASPAPPVIRPSDDLLVNGFGDGDGYQLLIADADRPSSWRHLATLAPPLGIDDTWIGRQCLTGDGRYVIATVAPRLSATHPDQVAHGGFAYSVDVTTGQVHPLASGVTLAYFSPGCGVASTVTLTSFATADDAPTTILLVDAATGSRLSRIDVPGQVTSALPAGPSVVAVEGETLVGLATGRAPRFLAAIPGRAYDVHANSAGGIDMLVAAGDTATVARWRPGTSLVSLGTLPLTGTRLVAGRGGATALVTDQPGVGLPGMARISAPKGMTTQAVSLDLDAQLLGMHGSDVDKVLGRRGTLATADRHGLGAASTSAALPQPLSVQTSNAVAPAASTTSPPNTSTPTCAVPRNDVHRQIVQPSPAQIDWAVNEITQSYLTGSRSGDPSWGLSAYSPATDFPISVLVPREVVSGILATESNWVQASWHALPGIAGNPLIANYYGLSSDGNTRDYSNADCGYGLSQQTDGMRIGDTKFSANVQQAIGLDYVENVAAGTWTLVDKWNQLKQLGITLNNGAPTYLENWYFAVWAYNSGIHPNDGVGNSGLGWANNPINPNYPAGRQPYRRTTTSDSSHPSDWPYQEQVIGWMETPLTSSSGNDYAPSSQWLSLPPHNLFCNASDSCNSSISQNPCTDAQSHCWWHLHASWGSGCTANDCTTSTYTAGPGNTEPATPANPYPPVCGLTSGSGPSSSALIVNSEADFNPNDEYVSLNGCSGHSGWSASGAFSASFGNLGMIDYHQLGVGFGGHMWFTHEVDTSDVNHQVTGTWSPTLPNNGGYTIWAFVPSDGATATDATYTVNDNNGHSWTTQPINQDTVSNGWVPLGTYPLTMGASVSLTNATAASLHDLSFDAVAFDPAQSLQSQYVALGDSYSSGQGDPPFDDVSARTGCNRSKDGYPLIFANQESTVYSKSTSFVACSGAVSQEMTVTGRDGEAPQLLWLSQSTKLVTVTIGGNDVGFAPIITSCAQGKGCGTTAFPTETAQIQAMLPRLHAVYQQITAAAPNATILVLTYPQILPPSNQALNCQVSDVGVMSPSDIQWIRDQWSAFNNVIKEAATGVSGVHVLDEENAFAGHSVCDSAPDANGIVLTNLNISFHPNSYGNFQLAFDIEYLLRLS